MKIEYEWRGDFGNVEVNELHAEAFDTRVFSESEWNWRELVHRHSLGWVVARDPDGRLVGFLNVPWDGSVHAWIQDVMVARTAQRQGIGAGLVSAARSGSERAGCEWLHVDFEPDLVPFYIDACGFTPANGGVIRLREAAPSE